MWRPYGRPARSVLLSRWCSQNVRCLFLVEKAMFDGFPIVKSSQEDETGTLSGPHFYLFRKGLTSDLWVGNGGEIPSEMSLLGVAQRDVSFKNAWPYTKGLKAFCYMLFKGVERIVSLGIDRTHWAANQNLPQKALL